MDYFNGLIENLSNKYTAILVSFLIGYVVGVSNFKNNSVLLSLLLGIVFAILAGLTNTFIEQVLTPTIMITLKVQLVFTLLLLITFFLLIT